MRMSDLKPIVEGQRKLPYRALDIPRSNRLLVARSLPTAFLQ